MLINFKQQIFFSSTDNIQNFVNDVKTIGNDTEILFSIEHTELTEFIENKLEIFVNEPEIEQLIRYY